MAAPNLCSDAGAVGGGRRHRCTRLWPRLRRSDPQCPLRADRKCGPPTRNRAARQICGRGYRVHARRLMPIGGQPTMRAFYGCEVTYPFVALQVLDAADSVHASLPNKYCDPKIAANLYHETLDEYLVADTVFRQIIDFQR